MASFSSQGFDLDAPQAQDSDDIVYEIGGGATVIKPPVEEPKVELSKDELVECEDLKRQGNEQFKSGNYLEAYDLYTEAIDACPGSNKLTGDEILKLRDEFEEEERMKNIDRHRLSEARRRKKENEDKTSSPPPNDAKPEPPAKFELPRQENNDKLAIYYCNRAATLQHMERYTEAIKDCDISVLLNPKYTKAFVRRSAAQEISNDAEAALRDAKQALELEPRNVSIRKSVKRLQKIEDERLEKLKEETLGKLKDLGNSLLGNFGLSLDNFAAVQDPKSGSYNISFNQSGS
jgi:tetratricopeptide (TPR) repeat protein